jgi:hypothetical protein
MAGMFSATLLTAASASALDLVKGFERGLNLPEQLGSDFILDEAATGGGDFADQTPPGFATWVAQYNDIWTAGDAVSITGLAIPIFANDTAGTNNSQPGDWTFTFFELSGGANPNLFDGYNFGTMTGEPILGQVNATLQPYTGNQTDEYFVKFDTPIDFTAQSSGFALHMQSTSTMRLKINTAAPTRRGVRVGLADGVAVGGANPNFAASFSGSPVALPPPGIAHRLDAAIETPGNRVWESIAPSQERFTFRNPQPGDYNGDGLTNAADYTVWRDNSGGDETLLAAGSRAPGAAGPVNAADYSHWAANYGSPASVPVNDPSVPGITAAFVGGAIGTANVFETVLDGQQASRQNGSFELWFKPDGLSNGDQILYEVGGTGAGSYLSLQDDTLSLYVKSAFAGNDQLVSTTLASDGWTQVVAVIHNTYSASLPSADDYVDLYVNGVLAATTELSPTDVNDWAGGNQAGLGLIGGVFASGGPLTDPGNASADFDLKGQIAIFEYTPTALTATDVAARYAAIASASSLAVPEPSAVLLVGLSLMLSAYRARR